MLGGFPGGGSAEPFASVFRDICATASRESGSALLQQPGCFEGIGPVGNHLFTDYQSI